MSSFFIEEREQAGWRFLMLWLLGSITGFAIGAGLEFLISNELTLFISVPLSAVFQAQVINRHISIYLPWAIGTSLLWLLGLAVSARFFDVVMTTDTLFEQVLFLFITGAIAGLFAGIPQWLFMRDWLPVKLWWLVITAVNYALFFIPSLVSGIILMRLITADKVPMSERHYEMSGKLDGLIKEVR